MSWGSGELVGALAFLLPGFVAGAIYHALTSHPKPSAFERVIQALIFTAIIQAIATPLPSSVRLTEVPLGAGVTWDPLWSTGLAVLIALLVVLVVNNDLAHAILRWLRLTRETSYPSPWASSFYRYRGRYVVLHLVGERRLYGWPEEWPNDPVVDGYIRIIDGKWLDDDSRGGDGDQDAALDILVSVQDVEMVEFVRQGRRTP